MDAYLEAAAARAAGVRAPADRPSRRRSAEPVASLAVVRATLGQMEVRAADDGAGSLTFEGVASVTEQAYEMYDMFGPYSEVVSASAFDATLKQKGLDVPLVIAHDQTRRIARTTNGTLSLWANSSGLRVKATLDPTDVDVAYIVPKLNAGLIDEMSFAFRIDAGQWSPDYSEFRIEKVDLHRGDVAIVGWGANPYTSGGVRAAAPKSGRDLVAEGFERAPRSLLT